MRSAQHSPPRDEDLCAHQRLSLASSSFALGTKRGDLFPSASTHVTTRRGVKVPTALAGPRTPVANPRSPVLVSHDFVLVRDKFIYIFQIKLVRHGAATLGPAPSQRPTPPQPQLPPAGNVFPPTQARGRFPQQRRDALRRPSEGQISCREGAGRSRRS